MLKRRVVSFVLVRTFTGSPLAKKVINTSWGLATFLGEKTVLKLNLFTYTTCS